MLSNVKGAAAAAWVLGTACALAGAGPAQDAAPRLEAGALPPVVPRDERNAPSYDEVGLAGRYAGGPAGRPTASGEPFDPAAFTAAHRTLPLGSYVEVTELDRGRTILVRINDRGPFGPGDRLVDLSPATADALGLTGVRPVRVRRTQPNIADRSRLAGGGEPVMRLDAPAIMLTALRKRAPGAGTAAAAVIPSGPTPVALPPSTAAAEAPRPSTPGATSADGMPVATLRPPAAATPASGAPAAVAGRWGVQAGVFSSEANARALARRLGGRSDRAGRFWRVRLGPYRTRAEADAARARAAAAGVRDARVDTAG